MELIPSCALGIAEHTLDLRTGEEALTEDRVLLQHGIEILQGCTRIPEAHVQ